jgi:hypothetical protein
VFLGDAARAMLFVSKYFMRLVTERAILADAAGSVIRAATSIAVLTMRCAGAAIANWLVRTRR